MIESTNKILAVATTYDDLMGRGTAESRDLGLRIFNNVAGVSIMGILLEETRDSFLVGLPARLMSFGDTNKRMVEPHVILPFIRTFKSTTLTLMPIFGEYEVYYLRYLLDEGKRLGPNIVVGKLEQSIEDRLQYLKDHISSIAEEAEEVQAVQQEENTSTDSDDSFVVPPSRMKH